MTKDRFHTCAEIVGWDLFEFSIIDICQVRGVRDITYLLEKEKELLLEYFPLLNKSFNYNHKKHKIYSDNLYSILKKRQLPIVKGNYTKIPVFKYEYRTFHLHTLSSNAYEINPNYNYYNSIAETNLKTGINKETIRKYLDTDIPIKNFLFYSKPVSEFSSKNELISNLITKTNIKFTENEAKLCPQGLEFTVKQLVI